MAELELTTAQVLGALRPDPIPAAELLTDRLGMSWPEDAPELRRCLLELHASGKADIEYGRGWYLTGKEE
jgi:hypothetical protein